MRAVIQRPGGSPETVNLGNKLKHLQELVGGYITSVHHETLEHFGITLWANDTGLFNGLEPNLSVYRQPIVGNVVFTGHDKEGDTVGLTDEQETVARAFLQATTMDALQRYRTAQRLAEM